MVHFTGGEIPDEQRRHEKDAFVSGKAGEKNGGRRQPGTLETEKKAEQDSKQQPLFYQRLTEQLPRRLRMQEEEERKKDSDPAEKAAPQAPEKKNGAEKERLAEEFRGQPINIGWGAGRETAQQQYHERIDGRDFEVARHLPRPQPADHIELVQVIRVRHDEIVEKPRPLPDHQ